MDVAAQLGSISQQILVACQKAKRDPNGVQLIAVSKKQSSAKILSAIDAGQLDFGENYVQEAVDKLQELEQHSLPKLRWHFIGQLQSNKVKLLAGKIHLLHSLDRLSLAEAIQNQYEKIGDTCATLVQVNIDEEAGKGGLAPGAVADFLAECRKLNRVQIRGLMCIPDPEKQKHDPRDAFRRLRELRDFLASQNIYPNPLAELSMGMSDDFEAAIAEGATYIRIGTAIFGARA